MQLVARNQESLMWRITFGVTLGQSTNGSAFNKSVGDIVVRWGIHRASRCTLPCLTILNLPKVRWISTTFKTSEKSTALDFIFLVACNLLHEIRNRWCEEWRSKLHWVNPRMAGYSINLWATSCAEWNLSCIKMHATMQQRLKRQKNPPHFILSPL